MNFSKIVFSFKVKWLVLLIAFIIPFALHAQDHNQNNLNFQVDGNVASESSSKQSDLYIVKPEPKSLDGKSDANEKPNGATAGANETAQNEKPNGATAGANETAQNEKPNGATAGANETAQNEKPNDATAGANETAQNEKPNDATAGANETAQNEKPNDATVGANETAQNEKPNDATAGANETAQNEKPNGATAGAEQNSLPNNSSEQVSSNTIPELEEKFSIEETLDDNSSKFLKNSKELLPDLKTPLDINKSLNKLNSIYKKNLKNYVLNKKDVHDIFMPIEDVIAASIGEEPQAEDAIIEDGTPLELKPRIQQLDLNQLKLIAIIISDSKDISSKALLEDTGGMGFIVEKGTLVGNKNGYIKELLPNKIIIEEPIKFRSGKTQLRITEKRLYVSDHEDPINLRHTDQ